MISPLPNRDPFNRIVEVTPEMAMEWLEGNTHKIAQRLCGATEELFPLPEAMADRAAG
jgi:hypothetical protein